MNRPPHNKQQFKIRRSKERSEREMDASQIAPFVLKTYEMVSDPNTDDIISWSRRNNSFVVIDPFAFSQRLLPTYFKHSNFSSFVRQLNTYGFRKVDPDRWEFGNEWFLRGQGQLLMNIARRRNCHEAAQAEVQHQNQGFIEETTEQLYGLAERLKQEEKVMMGVLGQLKEEQRAIEEEVKGISRRLQVTEKRPLQMMTFLVKVMENPDMIPRIIEEEEKQNKRKKPRPISGEQRQMETMGCPSQSWLGLEGQPGLDGYQDGLDCLQYQQQDLPSFSATSSIATASNEVRSVVNRPHSAPVHWSGPF